MCLPSVCLFVVIAICVPSLLVNIWGLVLCLVGRLVGRSIGGLAVWWVGCLIGCLVKKHGGEELNALPNFQIEIIKLINKRADIFREILLVGHAVFISMLACRD